MQTSRLEFGSLYLARFATSLGAIAVYTLLGTYVEVLGAEGIVVGLLTTSLTLTQTVAVVPIAWAGDRFDKRLLLLGAVALSIVTYVGFALVDSIPGFIAIRALQGVALVGTGMLSLALVGQLAGATDRANAIGKYNSFRMAAGIVGAPTVGTIYALYGFGPIFGLVALLVAVAGVGVWRFLEPDETRVSGFPFTDLALNERILTMTTFRAQYAVSVTLVRTWIPIYAALPYGRDGLALVPVLVGVTVASEKFTNMLGQPITGRLSDFHGRVPFVAVGGACYGLVALVVPFSPTLGAGLTATYPVLGTIPGSFLVLVVLNGLLGVADSLREPASMALFADEGSGEGITSSFGIRDLVWRPGSIFAPLLGGYLMTIDMAYVFYVGGAFAISGVLVFLGVLARSHGRDAVSAW